MTDEKYKIESLALAITKTTGGFDPQSEAFQLNNPGLLRSFSEKHKSEGHYRSFNQWQAGFKALCFDLTLKCSGNSRSELKQEDPLRYLLNVWEIKDNRKITLFLQRALNDSSINENTSLEYFINA